MAIFEYLDQNGNACFGVKIKIRSKINSTIEVQRKKKLGTITLKEAEKKERDIRSKAENELRTKEILGSNFKDLVTLWEIASYDGLVDQKALAETTIMDRVSTVRRFTKSWSMKPAASINVSDIRLVINEMLDSGLSRARIKFFKSSLNSLFTWGINNRKIYGMLTSPTELVKLPEGDSKKQPVLGLNQIKLFLEKAKELEHEYYYLWAMALLTGMRSGELYALEWSDVEFEQGNIYVCKSWNKRLNKIKSTKSNTWRYVPINQNLKSLLLEIKNQCFDDKYVLPRIVSWMRGDAAKVTRRFCESIGITEVTFHALRGCFATTLLQKNVDSASIMKVCGWTSLKTMQHYVRLAGIEVRGATDCLDILPEEVNGNVISISGG